MDDKTITQAIGLSDQDTTDLLHKYYSFVHTLNPAQQGVMRNCMPSFDQAAQAVGHGASADDVQKFVASRLSGHTTSAFPVPTNAPPASAAATSMPVPTAHAATAMPVPAAHTATSIPVPTAQSASGIPVPVKKSK